MITFTVEAIKNGSTFMSRSRGSAPAAELVCKVESTRCPVKAAFIAKEAVSLSRISPTMMMSGSCRTSERSPLAKVKLMSGLTCVWLTRGIRYSIGSSIVEIFTSGVFRMSRTVYKVVVLPQPVGPVASTIPTGRLIARCTRSSASPEKPRVSSVKPFAFSGKSRSTAFSPS